jgi:hypothetical protein
MVNSLFTEVVCELLGPVISTQVDSAMMDEGLPLCHVQKSSLSRFFCECLLPGGWKTGREVTGLC